MDQLDCISFIKQKRYICFKQRSSMLLKGLKWKWDALQQFEQTCKLTCHLISLYLNFPVAFLDVSTMELFFDLYSGLPPSLSPMVSVFNLMDFSLVPPSCFVSHLKCSHKKSVIKVPSMMQICWSRKIIHCNTEGGCPYDMSLCLMLMFLEITADMPNYYLQSSGTCFGWNPE